MEPRRPDDPLAQPAYVRPGPVRRHLAIRLVVTALALSLAYDAWTWIVDHPGPTGALALVLSVLTWLACSVAILWAWKKHPF